MSRDRWADVYCRHVQESFGPVDRAQISRIVERWLLECFPAAGRPRVHILRATVDGPPMEPDPLAPAAEWPPVHIDDPGAFGARMFTWFGRLEARDSDEILLVVADNMIAADYSHKWGDEATMYPITRRLWLALSGCDTAGAPPLLPIDSRIGTGRILAAAAQFALARPRPTLAAVRRLSRPDATGRIVQRHRQPSESQVSAAPATPGSGVADGWVLFIQVTAPSWGTADLSSGTTGKVPSILFFAHLLAKLNLSAEYQHSVMVDLRPYSPLLAGRSGNAIGPVSFTADWSTDTPDDLAASIGKRVRSGETLIRVATGIVAGAVISARARLRRGAVTIPSNGAYPSTSFSHVRLPADQDRRTPDGRTPYPMGMLSPSPDRLTVNSREVAGVADMTFAYVGTRITAAQVRAALDAVEVELGTRIATKGSGELFPRWTATGLPSRPVTADSDSAPNRSGR